MFWFGAEKAMPEMAAGFPSEDRRVRKPSQMSGGGLLMRNAAYVVVVKENEFIVLRRAGPPRRAQVQGGALPHGAKAEQAELFKALQPGERVVEAGTVQRAHLGLAVLQGRDTALDVKGQHPLLIHPPGRVF